MVNDAPLLVTPEEVLEVLENADEPFLSTGEVAERVDVSRPTALKRLETLEEEGAVRRRMIAGNTPTWYLPELENRRINEYTAGDTPAVTDGAPPTATGSDVRERAIDLLERFEQDLARESAQALTLSRLDLKKHFMWLLVSSTALVLSILAIFAGVWFQVLPDWALGWMAIFFVVALLGTIIAIGQAWYEYRKTFSKIQSQMSLGRGNTE